MARFTRNCGAALIAGTIAAGTLGLGVQSASASSAKPSISASPGAVAQPAARMCTYKAITTTVFIAAVGYYVNPGDEFYADADQVTDPNGQWYVYSFRYEMWGSIQRAALTLDFCDPS